MREKKLEPYPLQEEYEEYYAIPNTYSDSPEKSRIELRRGLFSILKELYNEKKREKLKRPLRVIGLCSGAHALEKEMFRTYNKEPHKKQWQEIIENTNWLTIDIARIVKKHFELFKKQNKPFTRYIRHITADAGKTLFSDNYFDLVYSNLGLDFLPREIGLKELNRILKPGGYFMLNLHHPDLLQSIDNKDEGTKKFWSYLQENNILYTSPEDIQDTFGRYGLKVDKIELRKAGFEKWWEVNGRKGLAADDNY